MVTMIYLLIIYIFSVSLISSIIVIKDKISAKKHRRRIAEKTLFLFAVFGGGVAMYLTMLSIGHKTRHKRFMIGLPLIVIFEGILCVLIYYMVK